MDSWFNLWLSSRSTCTSSYLLRRPQWAGLSGAHKSIIQSQAEKKHNFQESRPKKHKNKENEMKWHLLYYYNICKGSGNTVEYIVWIFPLRE